MYNSKKEPIWYGELRTSRGVSVVIHDKELHSAPAGRVYLYNAQRDAIIEYAEDIVTPNLHDIDDAAVKAAKKQYSEAYKAAKAAFIAEHPSYIDLATVVNAAPKPEPKPKIDLDEPAIDDDVVLDDVWEDDDIVDV